MRHNFDPVTMIYSGIYSGVLLGCILLGFGPFRFCDRPVFRWAGSVSHRVYPLHKPVVQAMGDLVLTRRVPPGAGFAAAVVIVAVIATLSLRILERPGQSEPCGCRCGCRRLMRGCIFVRVRPCGSAAV
jgi:peptidoglycan/LPS O-acetylase OafA/YrhL